MESGAVVLNARLPWPAVFTTFRPEVAQALKEQDESSLRKKLGRIS